MNALKLDLSNQSNCLYRATELGQLATEYLDDRKTELILLEEAVLNDRTMKQKSIEVVKEQVKAITKNVKELIRRDVTELERYRSCYINKEICFRAM